MKYFNYYEFDSPDIQGSGQLMDECLLEILDDIREEFGKPIKINSGYRTLAHNQKVGGKMPKEDGTGGSSHLYGLAVDIACDNSVDRFKLITILLSHGINRIGIAGTFIHIDVDTDKSPDVIWTY